MVYQRANMARLLLLLRGFSTWPRSISSKAMDCEAAQ
jgi:hypothetical protein